MTGRPLVRRAISALVATSILGAAPALASANPAHPRWSDRRASLASGVVARESGIRTLAVDDDIPGVPLSASPVTGTLSADTDTDDVFSIELAVGDALSFNLTGPAGTDFDMALFGPDATSVLEDIPLETAFINAYPEMISHLVRVGEAGTYYLDLYAYEGSGTYTLVYTIEHAAPPAVPDGPPEANDDGIAREATRFGAPLDVVNRWFGDSVAVSRDTLVIGEAANSNPAVWVAPRQGDGWGPLAKLPCSPASSGALGRSVDIDGDWIVAGAPNENKAYVWHRVDGVWALDTTLAPMGPVGIFGTDVAIDDGRIVVGGNDWVIIFNYDESTKSWYQPASLYGGGFFGCSVDIDGHTLVVGDSYGTTKVYRDDSGGWLSAGDMENTGRSNVTVSGDTIAIGTGWTVQIWERFGSRFEYAETLLPSVDANGSFGDSVALDGDQLAIGAKTDSELGVGNGAAYLFNRTPTGFIEGARMTARSFELGYDVAIWGDHVVAGTHGEGDGGAAYAFSIDAEIALPAGHVGVIDAPGVLANDRGFLLEAELVTDATNGTVELASDGSFTYYPNGENPGVDSFTYRVYDGYDYSDPAQVTLSLEEAVHDYVTIAGDNRFTTAVEVSKATFPGGADTVIIATGRNWPDALGGSALAGAVDGPILLADTRSIPLAVRSEIARLKPTTAIILGAEGALGAEVEDQLLALGISDVYRLGGPNRYETARLVAEETLLYLDTDWDGVALVATGTGFADALAGSPLAAHAGWPVYLADPKGSPDAFAGTLAEYGVGSAVLLGGEGVVSDRYRTALEDALPGGAFRVAGGDRYETAAEIASFGVDALGMSWDGVGIAAGSNFPDGLAGGVLCGLGGSVMLLTDGSALSPAAGGAL
ncbi:MAG: cell wall-binding repeat-containing protein, partial [Anaerolineae bacterium]